MVDYQTFKKIYDIAFGEPEFNIIFKQKDSEYMIIKYPDGPTFQRQGFENGSGEFHYDTLDELYESNLIDGINLKRDWEEIETIYPNEYGTLEELFISSKATDETL